MGAQPSIDTATSHLVDALTDTLDAQLELMVARTYTDVATSTRVQALEVLPTVLAWCCAGLGVLWMAVCATLALAVYLPAWAACGIVGVGWLAVAALVERRSRGAQ